MRWRVERVIREACLADVWFRYVGEVYEELFLWHTRCEKSLRSVLEK
jgi:hypothetical protein